MQRLEVSDAVRPLYGSLGFKGLKTPSGRSRWPRGLRRMSVAVRLLGLRVRIPSATWVSVMSVVLSGRGNCDGLITRPEDSYLLWCVVVCDIETS